MNREYVCEIILKPFSSFQLTYTLNAARQISHKCSSHYSPFEREPRKYISHPGSKIQK
jgi:hypothetical protein